MRFIKPLAEIEMLENLDIVLKVSVDTGNSSSGQQSSVPGGGADHGGSDFGL